VGRGSLSKRRWQNDRQRKKKERAKRNAPQPPAAATRGRRSS
jgi:hypothetical protein